MWRHWRVWAVIGGIFTALGLLNAVQLYISGAARGIEVEWLPLMARTIPYWHAKALLLPAVLWAARRFPFSRSNWTRGILPHVPLSLLYAAGHIALGTAVSFFMLGRGFSGGAYLAVLAQLFTTYLVVGIVYYWAFLGTAQAFQYYQQFRDRERAAADLELRASRLEGDLARARLDTLRMQLNPHFLFNTLNSVSVLAVKGDSTAVVRMLSRLSEVLRLTLDRVEPVVPLRDELAFLDAYLGIEQVRFGDRLVVEGWIDPRALDAEVPSLILQPLVENALKHGLGGIRGPVKITLSANVEGGQLELIVADSGRGFPALPTKREGVGLANTRARLEQLYRDEYRLELSSGSGAQVRITVPLTIPLQSHSLTAGAA